VVTLRDISKRYGSYEAISRVDLDFSTGKVTALIGPSGCGKSTLLRLILGLIDVTTGSVTVDGKTLDLGTVEAIRQKTGYVIQDGGLFPHLTAKGNVTLLAHFLGQDDASINSRLDELCLLTKIEPKLLDRYPAELSGGQKQRVALMRALMLQPKLLLLDEPLGALDPLVRAGLQTDLKEIFRTTGATVVFVTHDMGEAAFLADQIILLREGKVIQQGPYRNFVESPADPFVTEFLTAQRQVGAIA
jgi:osmoprotectant transport system ATP-binding protein